jgi:hypothetical protein
MAALRRRPWRFRRERRLYKVTAGFLRPRRFRRRRLYRVTAGFFRRPRRFRRRRFAVSSAAMWLRRRPRRFARRFAVSSAATWFRRRRFGTISATWFRRRRTFFRRPERFSFASTRENGDDRRRGFARGFDRKIAPVMGIGLRRRR